jgi:hypothetical protein
MVDERSRWKLNVYLCKFELSGILVKINLVFGWLLTPQASIGRPGDCRSGPGQLLSTTY